MPCCARRAVRIPRDDIFLSQLLHCSYTPFFLSASTIGRDGARCERFNLKICVSISLAGRSTSHSWSLKLTISISLSTYPFPQICDVFPALRWRDIVPARTQIFNFYQARYEQLSSASFLYVNSFSYFRSRITNKNFVFERRLLNIVSRSFRRRRSCSRTDLLCPLTYSPTGETKSKIVSFVRVVPSRFTWGLVNCLWFINPFSRRFLARFMNIRCSELLNSLSHFKNFVSVCSYVQSINILMKKI